MSAEILSLRPKAPALRQHVVNTLADRIADYLAGGGEMTPDALNRHLMGDGLAPTMDERVMAVRVATVCVCLRADYRTDDEGGAA